MVILFDVNGTLLDTRALVPQFQRIFGGAYSMEQWFVETVQYAMATTLAGHFREFSEIGGAVLEMAADARGVRLGRGDLDELRKAMQSLPPFPDVAPALQRLRSAHYRLVALSNSSRTALERQLHNAGVSGHFERALSVDAVRRYKPSLEVYRGAANHLGVHTSDLLMVAAHPWDLMGAAAAGCRTALIARPGAAPFPGAVAPDLRAADLDELTTQLLGTSARVSGSPNPLLLTAGLAALGLAASLLFGSRGTARGDAQSPRERELAERL